MPTVKRAYRVLPKHRDEVAGYEVVTGQILYLTDAEALYERDLGYIEATGTADEVPPPVAPFVRATDVVAGLRDGTGHPITVGDLLIFLVAPTITTPSIQIVSDGTAFSVTLAASSDATWAKTGGDDAALFQLTGATLSLPAQSYAAPADSNLDNAYAVEVTATNSAGLASAKIIRVMVVAPAVTPPSGSPSDLTTDFDDETNSALVPGLTA